MIFKKTKRLEVAFRQLITAIILSVSFFLLPLNVSAAEFDVRSFKRAVNDLSAIINTSKRLDDNDILCAIIKVRSDIKDLKFTASTPIVGNVEFKFGEYWIYLSEGTRQLSVFADGFIKLSYTFPERIEQGAVYIMEITSKTGTIIETGKGNLIINSNIDSIKVSIDGFPDIVKYTPCSFQNYRSGIYKLHFFKKRYHPKDTIISIDNQVTKQIFINLKPVWGNLIVKVTNTPATFTINNNIITGTKLNLSGEKNGLDEGIYQLRISADNYYDTTLSLAIKSDDTVFMTVEMKPVLTTLQVRSNPSGAKVFVDDNYVGTTPFTGKFITGSHTLKLIRTGYIKETKVINLEKEISLSLNITLKTSTFVKISSNPPGAKLFLNGKLKGKTPLKIKIFTGYNNIKLTKKNYEDINAEVSVVPDTNYSFNLKKKKYNLTVKTLPAGFDIKINNADKGQTPKTFPLEYGTYKVTLSKKGYVSRKKNINLKNNETLSLKMIKRLYGYLGMVVFIPKEDYDIFKIGAELGWSYQKIPNFISSFGIAYGQVDDIDYRFDELNVYSITPSGYEDLNLNNLTIDGFTVKNSLVCFWRLGVYAYKPFRFGLTTIMGVFTYKGYDVYIADKEYIAINYPYKNIAKGDYLANKYGERNGNVFKYGLGMQVKLGLFYIGMDYWMPHKKNSYGSKFSVTGGITF
jgi:5-hydroxyisourate hydrolase-like protein (transthyretin family)